MAAQRVMPARLGARRAQVKNSAESDKLSAVLPGRRNTSKRERRIAGVDEQPLSTVRLRAAFSVHGVKTFDPLYPCGVASMQVWPASWPDVSGDKNPARHEWWTESSDAHGALVLQTEGPGLQLRVPGSMAELWVSPIVACRLCLGRVCRQPGFTVGFRRLFP